MKKETIIRTVFLFFALINQILTMLGINPLPWSNEQMYEGVSAIVTVVAAVWAWWKNNSFTKNAQEADAYLDDLRALEKVESFDEEGRLQ